MGKITSLLDESEFVKTLIHYCANKNIQMLAHLSDEYNFIINDHLCTVLSSIKFVVYERHKIQNSVVSERQNKKNHRMTIPVKLGSNKKTEI
jgi:hypothetical protein